MKRKYFTLSGAQRLVGEIPARMSNEKLQKHIVKLRDFKGYMDYSDMPRLIEGGYFGRVMDSSATGLVPMDIWLHTNLGQALDEATKERSSRL